MEPKDEEEKKRSTEELVNSFFQYMMLKMELVYGNAHTEWWNTNGRNLFFAWAKQIGIEFTDNDFDRTPPFLQKLDEEAVEDFLYDYCNLREYDYEVEKILNQKLIEDSKTTATEIMCRKGEGRQKVNLLAKAICSHFGTPKIEVEKMKPCPNIECDHGKTLKKGTTEIIDCPICKGTGSILK